MKQDQGRQNHIVATKLPEGKKLYSTAGCSEDPDRLLEFARRCCGNCPADLEAVTAESCLLEWRNESGDTLPWSESYRRGKWVLLTSSHGAM